MLGGRKDFNKLKAGGSISARDENSLRREVRRLAAMIQRQGMSGSEGVLFRGRPVRLVKLVWGRIVERFPPGGTPPYPAGPTGLAGSFTYIAESIDGAYRTLAMRPVLVTYNDLPEVIAAPTVAENKRNSLCIMALDAPDDDDEPSIQLVACRERLNFENCPPGGGDALADTVRSLIAQMGGVTLASVLPPPPAEEIDIASLLDSIQGLSGTRHIYGMTSLADPAPVEHTVVIEHGLITSWTVA